MSESEQIAQTGGRRSAAKSPANRAIAATGSSAVPKVRPILRGATPQGRAAHEDMFDWFKTYRRRQLLVQPFHPEWLQYLSQGVRHWSRLSEPERSRLCDCVRIIIAETYWEGCQGFSISDEVRVTIAGNASLMLLGTEAYYFDGVRTILVFPGSFARRVQDGFLVTEGVHRSGEAYQSGTIVLSWEDVEVDRHYPGHNVVIHEFAHHIDGLDGAMEGTPPLSSARELQQWRIVARREFEQLVQHARQGRRTLLDHYGAKSPAEFFAVASECFFERAADMQRQHTRLFDLFTQLYGVDPRTWSASESSNFSAR